jgi:uncharacterized protein with PQ loop repeat
MENLGRDVVKLILGNITPSDARVFSYVNKFWKNQLASDTKLFLFIEQSTATLSFIKYGILFNILILIRSAHRCHNCWKLIKTAFFSPLHVPYGSEYCLNKQIKLISAYSTICKMGLQIPQYCRCDRRECRCWYSGFYTTPRMFL